MNTETTNMHTPTTNFSLDVGRSPYHLSEEQIAFFDENGYLILRNWIPQDLLQRLQAAGTQI